MKLNIWELLPEAKSGFSRFSGPSGVAAARNQLDSALLRPVNQTRLGILAGRRKVCGLSFMGPKSIKPLAPEGLDSRIPEAPLCCALRTNRGMAFWPGGAVSLPSIEEVGNSPELSQFQMKICIGELFLEAQAGFLDFLAQAEWPRFGIHSTPLCCAL